MLIFAVMNAICICVFECAYMYIYVYIYIYIYIYIIVNSENGPEMDFERSVKKLGRKN
jgi:hypothetical protein